MVARILLYVVTALLIGAHFLRLGDIVGVALSVVTAPLYFLVRQRWNLLLLQGLAFAAAGLWLWTAWQIAAMGRMLFGQPWLRAAAILAVVAAISAFAGVLLHSQSLQPHYRDR